MNSQRYRNSSNFPNNNRKLTLNFSPIHFEDAEIEVGIFPYESKEQLSTLRRDYTGLYLFHRDREQILSVALMPNVAVLGESSSSIRLSEKLYLTAALVRNSLINFLHNLDRKILRYDPIEFVADPQKNNLLTKVFPSDIQVPTWLSICPCYKLAIRTVYFDRQPMSLGLALNAYTKRWIDLSCNLLIEKGMNLAGLYVSELVQPSDLRMAFYSRLLGQVQSVEGEKLRLTDTRDNFDFVATSDVFLEPRQEAFKRCLEYLLQEQTSEIEKNLDNELANFRSGSFRLKHLQNIAKYISDQSLEILPGVKFSLQSFLSEAGEQRLPSVHIAPRTTYVFDAAGEKTDTWHDRGLNEYGPYTAPTFTPSSPRVCVICQKNRKGRVEQFLHKLLYGMVVQELSRKGKQQPSPIQI